MVGCALRGTGEAKTFGTWTGGRADGWMNSPRASPRRGQHRPPASLRHIWTARGGDGERAALLAACVGRPRHVAENQHGGGGGKNNDAAIIERSAGQASFSQPQAGCRDAEQARLSQRISQQGLVRTIRQPSWTARVCGGGTTYAKRLHDETNKRLLSS